jgi:hypothetical protein
MTPERGSWSFWRRILGRGKMKVNNMFAVALTIAQVPGG